MSQSIQWEAGYELDKKGRFKYPGNQLVRAILVNNPNNNAIKVNGLTIAKQSSFSIDVYPDEHIEDPTLQVETLTSGDVVEVSYLVKNR